jgi:hypothetical protein
MRHPALTATLLAAGLLPAACASFHPTPYPDTARLLPGAFGGFSDPDVTAVQQAQYAFAYPARTRGLPIEAARGAAGVDYMAGELSSSPRWAYMSPIIQMQMLQARTELRQTLGVTPDAPSQAVVNGLLHYADARAAGDPEAATEALNPVIFTYGPARTEALLTNMPYMQEVNIATTNANVHLSPSDGGGGDMRR